MPALRFFLAAVVATGVAACGGDSDPAPTPTATLPVASSPTPSTTTAATSDGRWMTITPLAAGPRQETAVVEFGGEIVVIGGFDGRGQVSSLVEAYAPGTREWRRLPDLPVAMHHANAAVVAGRLYIVGFLTGANFAPNGAIYVLLPGAQNWATVGKMPAGKERGSSGVAVIEDRIYLAGGLRNGSVADFSRYDPAKDTWEDLPPVPERRDHVAAGAVSGKFILAGGRGGAITSITGRVDIFDPVTATWSRGASMPTPRAGTAAAVLGGKLYVFGGEGNPRDPSGVFPETEAYDLATDTWKQLPPMPSPRHGTGAATLGDVIYVPGGATKQAFGAVAVAAAFVP